MLPTKTTKPPPSKEVHPRTAEVGCALWLLCPQLADRGLQLRVLGAEVSDLGHQLLAGCNLTGSCGKVVNEKGSKGSVVVSNSWDAKKKRLSGKTCVLSPGQDSDRKCGKSFKDTDGVRIPKGLKGKIKLRNGKGGVKYRTLGPGDHKLRDYEKWTIRIVKG